MSLYDYQESEALKRRDSPFYALIMAAMRKADDVNITKLRALWPEVWDELQQRYWAPGGLLPGEQEQER